MIEQAVGRAGAARLQIVRAAAHEFARKPYSHVSLDDILAQTTVTKGAMYFHFRSKHELALAVIEHQALAGYESMTEVLARRLSALETLIDMSCLIALRDLGDDVARAGLNLVESIGRADGTRMRILDEWVRAFAVFISRAVDEGDVLAESNPEDVSRLLVSMYMGVRQTSDIDDPARLFTDLRNSWLLTLPGFANPARIGYLTEFVRRRTALAITNASAVTER